MGLIRSDHKLDKHVPFCPKLLNQVCRLLEIHIAVIIPVNEKDR